jgi:serine/threonine protein kinase/tetratricopeptide (TPR) repeat protein
LKNRLTSLDVTISAHDVPRQELLNILERYMADLERGAAPSEEALLAAHADLADELRPYLESLRLLDGATRDMRLPRAGSDGERGEGAGARQIGEYRIVREIGRGGMGIVYEAHQKSLNRRVALKILPFAAVLDQRQIARFRNEAQAAAQLHHPNIVPVFAVGQEQGVNYYAMQYIDGQSLEQAIRELRANQQRQAANSTKGGGGGGGSTTTLLVRPGGALPSNQSLDHGDIFQTVARLGKQAAEALHHAHEHGIVHRDVKPSNLLIDGDGKLWVTDFGLARIQTDNGVTLTGDVIGTLRYMSPEQANGSGLVDARTDVYSLGLTLYELITQTQAHPGDDRQTLIRQIINEEPIAPRKINSAVPIELETIVLGAMARARDERYLTAQALADDLGRFLEGKPTLARRPSAIDRLSKWSRRHRSLVAVAAAALVLLSVVSAVGMVMLVREQRRTSTALAESELHAAEAQKNYEQSERYFHKALSVVDQFGVRLSDRLVEIPGAEPVRRDLLLDTLRYYHQFALDAKSNPALRRETALAHFRSAAIAARLGAVDEAIKEYKSAQQLFSELVKADAEATDSRAQLALAHNNLGLIYASRADAEGSRQEYIRAIEIQKALVRSDADNPTFAGQLSESEANLGLLLDQAGDASGAAQALEAAIKVLRPLSDPQKGQPKFARDLAIALNNLSYVLRKSKPEAADVASQEAIDILEHLAQSPANGSDFQDDLALCYNNRAALQIQKGDWKEAIKWHKRAITLQEKMVRKSPAVVRYRSDLAISLNNVGMAYCKAAKSKEADAAFGRARDLFDTLADDFPDEVAYRSSLAALLNNQALALAGVGRHADALQIYPKAIQAQRTCFERVPKSEMMRELLSKMYYNYGQSLRAERRFDEATQAALARRQLWKGSGERLVGVAAELADIAAAMPQPPVDDKSKFLAKNLAVDILATLNQAYESGWPGTIDLNEPRFASLKKNEQFANEIAELNERAIGSAKDKLNNREMLPTNGTPSSSGESSSRGRAPG